MGEKNKHLSIILIILTLIFYTGCECLDLFDTGIRPDDPYDENCNLKPSYHDGGWKKYSDIDYRIPVQSRSPEAQKYFNAQQEIAEKSAQIYTNERDSAIEEEKKKLLIEYKEELRKGHTANLARVFLRMSFFTADTVFQNYYGAKGMMTNIMDPTKNTVQLVGEGIKYIDSYDPDNSAIAIDTSTVKGKVNDVARAGWEETIASYGNPKDVALEMTKKSIRYAMGAPDPKITPAELDILKAEHLEKKRIDAEIQTIDKGNFDRMWEIRKLQQDITYLKSDLWDYEHDEKDRTDDMLIAECKEKIGDEK